MPLNQRPWSINSYALSKCWYKCNCLDLRAMDINTINSKVKAWLYADQLEKPELIVLYRPVSFGGLGLHHVELKAKAMLIRSFLETAANPKFNHSLYHNTLYRYHVLQEITLPNPGLPPNYSDEFFSTIRSVHENAALNPSTMSSSQWYNLLLENILTTPSLNIDSERIYIPSRSELINPQIEWQRTWRLARLKGLGPDLTTFLWRLLHRLLPTQDRGHRIVRNPNSSPTCQLCQVEASEDRQQAFFDCQFNNNAGNALLSGLSNFIPDITSHQILLLDLDLEDKDDEHPAVWLIGHFLSLLWASRIAKKAVRLYTIRSDLEARASLLSETKFNNCGLKIRNLIQLCFANL